MCCKKAYYIARDTKKKTIVLGIRGSLSPRDILTDLCASCENFLVEDNSEIGDIAVEEDINNATIPPLIVGCGHKGMVDAARSVARMTAKTISDELDAHKDYSLVIDYEIIASTPPPLSLVTILDPMVVVLYITMKHYSRNIPN